MARRKPEPTRDVTPHLGRPPEGTKNGTSRMRYELPDEQAAKVRAAWGKAFAESGIELGPFQARTICKALDIILPPPRKRGPKPSDS